MRSIGITFSTPSGQARDVFGFFEDQTSVLTSPSVYHRMQRVLASDLPPLVRLRRPSGVLDRAS